MQSIDRDALEAAAARLSGHALTTPLIGQPLVPGRATPPGLRVKAEVLQVGGSVWFRGAMHALARRLGALPGLAVHGGLRQVLGVVAAAHAQRIPVQAWLRAVRDPAAEELFAAFPNARVEFVTDTEADARLAAAQREGVGKAPAPGEADFDLGIATLAAELDRQMPSDVVTVYVAPAFAAAPVAAGLRALGRGCAVEGCREDPALTRTWRGALRAGTRIDVGAASCAAFDAAWRQAASGGTAVAVLGI